MTASTMRMEPRHFYVWIVLLCLSHGSYGKLVFRAPVHPPRIYSTAPEGVHVTRIHAFDPDSPRRPVTYSLLDVRDHAIFAIDPESGNLTTAASVDQEPGFTFHVIVVALSQGLTELRQLEISVTEYNRFAPEFEHAIYRGDLHMLSPVRTPVLIVEARDADAIPYNAQVHYSLDQNVSSTFFEVEPQSGQLTVARTLPSGVDYGESLLAFGVFAQDGGSPARWAHARVEIQLKNISEPQNVRSANPTDTTVDVCWSRPVFGQTVGYLIKYREMTGGAPENSYLLNITTSASAKCTTITRLRPWTDYQFRVYAWNYQETGIASEIGTMGTRPNYCRLNVCKQGECHALNVEPGYWCECPFGYYGANCEMFDPCSTGPCQNFGACRNTSHNEYACDCLSGFSGRNCSEFNPCAIRPSPCLNGASCQSSASHTYNCLCVNGFYGKTCQRYDPCATKPCANGAKCHNLTNTEYACACLQGYSGMNCEQNVDECRSSPCKNGATCVDRINGFRCICPPGYQGHNCHYLVQCPREVTTSDKGIFTWDPTDQGSVAKATCPFGYRPLGPYPSPTTSATTARRRCRLLASGEVVWSKVQDQPCREEAFRSAELLSETLESLTEDPTNLTSRQLRDAVKKMHQVVDFAAKDQKIAQSLLTVVSNMMAVNDSILEQNDAAERIVNVVDRYTSEVQLEPGQSIEMVTENLALKAISIRPSVGQTVHQQSALSFSMTVPDRPTKNEDNSVDDEQDTMQTRSISIPLEALFKAQDHPEGNSRRHRNSEVRIKFVAYRNSKLFRNQVVRRKPGRRQDLEQCVDPSTGISYLATEPGVLQASVHSSAVHNLSEPVVYILPTPPCLKAQCVYWDESEKAWSSEGVWTNVSGNTTLCYSSHLTAFSILLDLDPDLAIPDEHKLPLSIISYMGCALSILGLLLTIITYVLFRCLNRDRSGKILLNLCISMLLMNAAFVAGSQQGVTVAGLDVCVLVAVLLHYFLLASLAWMGVEALNMYQLLIHVFASAESRFMLKRCLLGWGLPLVVVGVTVAVQAEEYFNKTNYCMVSPKNPYIYYISFLGPSCLILLVNLCVFVLVARVLFTPRLASNTHLRKNSTTSTQVVTLAQVRGAFTVMVLLGVTWVFGALAIGELKLFFQYIFCIANSLQGFLIFIVRCLCYPEARAAWSQLLRTGTLKKYRGMVPPGTGSWYGNSSSNPQQQKGANSNKSRSKRTNSNDSTSTVVFNSNYWNSNHRASQNGHVSSRLSTSSILKNVNLSTDTGWPRTCHTFSPNPPPVTGTTTTNGTSRIARSNKDLVMTLDQNHLKQQHVPLRTGLDRLSTIGYIDEDDQETKTESSPDLESYTRRLTLPLVAGHGVSSAGQTRSYQAGEEATCDACDRLGYACMEHNEAFNADMNLVPL